MKEIFIVLGLSMILASCRNSGNVLQISQQGSFAVGGTILTDSLGHTYLSRTPFTPENIRSFSPTA